VELGYKAQVLDNADGVVLDHTVVVGNPADAPMLVPAIARITARFGHAPTALTADRGYGEAKVDDDLVALGVQRVAIPRRGKPGAARQKVQRGVPSPSWSSGARAARRASPTSSVTTAGHVHAPMGSAVPRGGVGGACSPTTPPRSAP
jgi:IS5 family transposase